MAEQPELILWCKPIFVSNPTELGKVMLWLELSWGCDNNILLQRNFLLHQTNFNHTNQTKPNQAQSNQTRTICPHLDLKMYSYTKQKC